MCCNCCKARFYWFSKCKINQLGCDKLVNLAAQAEDYYRDGIDIQSQKTNEQLDEDDDKFEIYANLDEIAADGGLQVSFWDD